MIKQLGQSSGMLLSTSQTQHQMKSWLFLYVVVAQSAAIFKLLASENQSLLVWRNTLFILDFGLHILNGFAGFNLTGDGFSCQVFDKDLHATMQVQHKVDGWFLLDVLVAHGMTIF